MLRSASRSGAVALTSAALMGLSALAIPAVAAADDTVCAPEDVTYSVTGGTIEWGVKQSFRNYLNMPFVEGGWNLGEGVTFQGAPTGADGRFIWPVTSGAVTSQNSAAASGEGEVHLHGHHGALDTRISNPTVEIDGDEGVLKMDYRGTELNMDPNADPVYTEGTQVVAATFDLNAAGTFHKAGTVTVGSDRSILHSEFVPALGNYAAGSEMDPVTLNLEVSSACEPGGGDNGGGDNGGDDNGGDDDDNTGGGIFGSLGNIFGSLGF
ncbi:HtaA domain-containing protein [Dietzia aurantiaca]|uniref:HtaA domain-containing protein n=1 Tax=Dietzia aurantiaca TaxID=983873 RepID=UPI001E4E8C9C|nr:HtaA domain-containing protein [Dietzia aurantiaca]MCD2263010.1 HtaA domain-containing protein [Dietzia aurantiaca]